MTRARVLCCGAELGAWLALMVWFGVMLMTPSYSRIRQVMYAGSLALIPAALASPYIPIARHASRRLATAVVTVNFVVFPILVWSALVWSLRSLTW